MTSPYYQSGPVDQPINPTPAPKKKSRVPVWIGVGVAALVVICCGSVVGAVALDSDPEPKVKTQDVAAPVTSSPSPFASTTDPDVTETTEAPEPASDTFDLPLGTTVVVTTDDGTVEVTVSKQTKFKSPRTTACKPYMPKPDNGYYLVFNVKMEVVKGTGSINPLYFTYVSPDGATDEGLGGSFSGCGDSMDSGNDLRTGTKRSGQLVFDTASKKGSIEFGGTWFGGGVQASWKVA